MIELWYSYKIENNKSFPMQTFWFVFSWDKQKKSRPLYGPTLFNAIFLPVKNKRIKIRKLSKI
jgi:hypothetical protein